MIPIIFHILQAYSNCPINGHHKMLIQHKIQLLLM